MHCVCGREATPLLLRFEGEEDALCLRNKHKLNTSRRKRFHMLFLYSTVSAVAKYTLSVPMSFNIEKIFFKKKIAVTLTTLKLNVS